jgi:hypothetical protein
MLIATFLQAKFDGDASADARRRKEQISRNK